MAHPAVNTKVERAVEAVESLARACAAKDSGDFGNEANIADARTELADALRDVLQPVLRLVE
jgi:hypothetical protein